MILIFNLEAPFQAQVSASEVCNGRRVTGRGFVFEYFCFPLSIIAPLLPTHLHVRIVFTRKTNRGNLCAFQKAVFFSEIGEHCIEKYFHLFRL
jgi:hypothetical protein